jgi:hypothetical protein
MIVGGNPSNPVIGHTQLPRGGHGIDVSADATEYKVYWRIGRDPLSQCARRVDRPPNSTTDGNGHGVSLANGPRDAMVVEGMEVSK